ncbi:MAG: bifunctional methylenetetrahydrofolate dehydrogenase/methenyltetrahydrofolate cyclohydrolase FolD [Nevskiaceae bacterium]|jgi:methylenetetrahydrofolate dehydrogenase (NADP+)/methenyltetrahydrofolate cyclohydrolase|nr:bifunctional methylenetetrahydrofolate dehydrogenase/methenyltetrahydrofolate cyclohydrolase FolD [Nevskiaceae bacterium]
MTAKVIDGKAIAQALREEIKTQVSALREAGQRPPGLAVVIVGEDPASQIYVRNKHLATEAAGMRSIMKVLPATASQQQVLDVVAELNADATVDGILVQLPVPKQIDGAAVIDAIAVEKDVDGFNPENLGLLAQRTPRLRPCTPYGCMKMLEFEGINPAGMDAVVLGQSNIVGRPAALELLMKGATVTICHSRTKDLPGHVRRADLIVAGIGKPEFVQGDWIKPGAVVLDVGINRLPSGKVVGDVDYAAASQRAGYITPVPGGVGPMTIAMLIQNTLEAYRLRNA